MNQTTIHGLFLLPFVLCGGFLMSILCGVFEDRTQENYRFRLKRFLAVIIVILLLNLSTFLFTILKIKDLWFGASHVGEVAVMKDRAVSEYALVNLGVMFPKILNDKTKQCYRAALSNYVEDDWNKSFGTAMWQHDKLFCRQNPSTCNGKQDDYFDVMRNKANPFHLLLHDLSTIGPFLATDWTTAAESYRRMRQLTRQLDNKGVIPPPPDKQMLANYRKYITNCSTLEPLPWITLDEPPVKSKAVFCIGRCE